MLRSLTLRLFSFAFVVFVLGSYVIFAQTALTGEWTASTKDEKPDKIQLNFEFRRSRS